VRSGVGQIEPSSLLVQAAIMKVIFGGFQRFTSGTGSEYLGQGPEVLEGVLMMKCLDRR